jgi:hypothetical protein
MKHRSMQVTCKAPGTYQMGLELSKFRDMSHRMLACHHKNWPPSAE